MLACFQASKANFLGESGSIMNPAHEFDEIILLLELKNRHIRTNKSRRFVRRSTYCKHVVSNVAC